MLTYCDVEIKIFWDNLVHNMAADGLASCVARAETAMILITQDKGQVGKIIVNENKLFYPQLIQHKKRLRVQWS